MAIQTALKFMARLRTNAEIRQTLDFQTLSELVCFAADAGFEFTEAEFRQAFVLDFKMCAQAEAGERASQRSK